MARRQMYKGERLDTFLGLQISSEMHSELLREAERVNCTKAPFIRTVLAEGLGFRRLKELRVFTELLREADSAECGREELLRLVLETGLATWRTRLKYERNARSVAAPPQTSLANSFRPGEDAAKRGA